MLHFFPILAPEVEREPHKTGEGSISPVKRFILMMKFDGDYLSL
jgi:hypothetical protein